MTDVTNRDALGILAPVIGPWFDEATRDLPPPQARLCVAFDRPQGPELEALPPLTGLLSYFHWAQGGTVPAPLARFRDAGGAAAFDAPGFVALLEVLPEVRERLAVLLRRIPLPDQGGALPDTVTPSRPVPAFYAVEMPGLTGAPALRAAVHPALPADQPLSAVGLENAADTPIRDLKRPAAGLTGGFTALATIPGGQSVRIWWFDAAGQPLEPGAVAAWLAAIAGQFENLWADGLGAQDRRTAPTQPGGQRMVVQAVTPAGAALGDAALARLDMPQGAARLDAGLPVWALDLSQGQARIGVTPGGGADDAPLRMAPLPHGPYRDPAQTPLILPALPAPARDFLRVALLDVEDWLTGQPRSAPQDASDPVRLRAAMQARPSTRIRVARATTATLHRRLEPSAAALVQTVRDGAGALIVTGAADPGWGAAPDPFAATPALGPGFPAQGALPPRLDDVPGDPAGDSVLRLAPLAGAGSLAQGKITGQAVVLHLKLGGNRDALPPGTVARAWLMSVAGDTGRLLRRPAAAGRVTAQGELLLHLSLPDGLQHDADSGDGVIRVDLLLMTGAETRRYVDLHLPRPDPAAGPARTRATTAAADSYILPEAGAAVSALDGATHRTGWLPPGQSVFLRAGDGSFHAVDAATLEPADFTPDTLAGALSGPDRLDSAAPAFGIHPKGSAKDRKAQFGDDGQAQTSVTSRAPGGFRRPDAPGGPLAGQDRLETVATAGARCVLHGGPTVDSLHEGHPHALGHPGTRAEAEIHGVGLTAEGPAGHALGEMALPRTTAGLAALAQAAQARGAPPAAPAGAGLWVAGLQTLAQGMAGSAALAGVMDNPLTAHTYGGTLGQAATQAERAEPGAQAAITALGAQDQAEMLRALERQFHVTQHGAREGLVALAAAFGRAERLVYLEAPCLEAGGVGPPEDRIDPVAVLAQRLRDRPGLHVVICTSARMSPFLPKRPAELRRVLLREAVTALQAAGPGRVSVFVPDAGPGRSLRLTSSVAVVDDAFALLGRTHFWRRGLSFDTSLAAALFDETLSQGRPRALRAFRRDLMAHRLGIAESALPDDTDDLTRALAALQAQGGLGRLSVQDLAVKNFTMTEAERAFWNPDGSIHGAFMSQVNTWAEALVEVTGGVLANPEEAGKKAESEGF